MWDVRHALGTGSDNDVSIAGDDGLGANDECLDRRGAHLVDGGRDDRFGEASTDCHLACWVLAEAAGCQYDCMEGARGAPTLLT